VYNEDNSTTMESLGYTYDSPLSSNITVPLPGNYAPASSDRQAYNRLLRDHYIQPLNNTKLKSLSLQKFEVTDTDPNANSFRSDMAQVLELVRKRAIKDKHLSYIDQYNSKLIIKRGFSTSLDIEGEQYSPHGGGIVADIYAPTSEDRTYLKGLAKEFNINGIGVSESSQYVHIDLSSKYEF
jgi:hypothetical protein